VEVVYAGGITSPPASSETHKGEGRESDPIALLQEHHSDSPSPCELGRKTVAYTGLSENMDIPYWREIEKKVSHSLRRKPHGILVTHGTESMEQTVKRLQWKYFGPSHPREARIILTGANDDLEAPATDVWENLELGLQAAASDLEPGVYVAFHGRVVPAEQVIKLPFCGGENTFVSLDSPIYANALRSQEDHVHDLVSRLEQLYGRPQDEERAVIYNVNLVRANHQGLLKYLSGHEVKGIILNLYHSGTANVEKQGESVAELVEKLRTERGIVFFGVTENGEPVDLHAHETSIQLREAGVVPLYDMLRDVAFAKLRLMDESASSAQLIEAMLHNDVGEIDEQSIVAKDIAALKRLYS